MSDTGLVPPCSRAWIRDIAWFVGETARPVSLALVGTGTVIGFLIGKGVAELTVMSGTLSLLYGARSIENFQIKKVGG